MSTEDGLAEAKVGTLLRYAGRQADIYMAWAKRCGQGMSKAGRAKAGSAGRRTGVAQAKGGRWRRQQGDWKHTWWWWW